MSREWVDDMKKRPKDKRWVMRCDVGLFDSARDRCPTESEPSVTQPELWQFAAEGWWIGAKSGDVCPACLAEGYMPTSAPHNLMLRFEHLEQVRADAVRVRESHDRGVSS